MIKGDDKAIVSFMDRLKGKLPEIMKSGAMNIAAPMIQNSIIKTVRDLSEDSRGGLGESYKPFFVGFKSGNAVMKVVSDLAYARIQDEGGWIKPRLRQNLAIPIHPSAKGFSPESFGKKNLTLIVRKRGPPLLVRLTKDRPSGRQITALMFVLKRTVYIPPKNYLRVAMDRVQPSINAKMLERVGDNFEAVL